MQRLGIVVDHLGATQLAYTLIQGVNRLTKSRPDVDVVVFYERLMAPCVAPNFATMGLAEAWGYTGPLVAATFTTAESVLRYPAASRRLFWVWDLEWTRPHKRLNDFRRSQAVYGNENLELVARGEDHALVLSQCWNRPMPSVVKDGDIEGLLKLAHV